MNTYIQVFKNKTKHSRLLVIFCVGSIIVGVIGLVMEFVFKMSFIPLINEASYFSFIFYGSLFLWIDRENKRREKYFVSWDDREISYLLPKSDKTELIKIDDIKSVVSNQSEIIIELKNTEKKHFKLNYFFFPVRQTVIDFFEEVKKRISIPTEAIGERN